MYQIQSFKLIIDTDKLLVYRNVSIFMDFTTIVNILNRLSTYNNFINISC